MTVRRAARAGGSTGIQVGRRRRQDESSSGWSSQVTMMPNGNGRTFIRERRRGGGSVISGSGSGSGSGAGGGSAMARSMARTPRSTRRRNRPRGGSGSTGGGAGSGRDGRRRLDGPLAAGARIAGGGGGRAAGGSTGTAAAREVPQMAQVSPSWLMPSQTPQRQLTSPAPACGPPTGRAACWARAPVPPRLRRGRPRWGRRPARSPVG